MKRDIKAAELHYKNFLEALGLSTVGEHIEDTPARVVKMYGELFAGYDEPTFKFTTFSVPPGGAASLITMSDIVYYSLCSHHIIPFFGKATVSYLPKEKICGLSKLARVVKHFAAKLQVQENMTGEIADFLYKELDARAVAVHITGEHLCMAMRGCKVHGSNTTTTAIRGEFLTDSDLKNEWMGIVNAK